ncbi:hypothetical protein PG993_013439 [Apiospora rasikravindrae]|uniref:F-box domain-containing protein n=1 Tax=Apiospora rasikravindrae TaxID=990691 RepID=A0ABR1RYW1_9PEZI
MAQTLSDDIFWHTAKWFLDDPVDVFNLARTCHSLWNLLETEMYKTEIFWTDRKEKNERWEDHPFARAWTYRDIEWDGPLTPDTGLFPHEAIASPAPYIPKYDDTEDEDDEEKAGPTAGEEPPRWKGLTIL